MSKKGKIKLDIGTRSFYMDGVKRSGCYIQEETKAVNGILRNISGKAAEIFPVQRQDRSVGQGLRLGCSKRERRKGDQFHGRRGLIQRIHTLRDRNGFSA